MILSQHSMPNVSVIIPTHNRPELLKRAIASVQAQTYRDFELIVIEDRESKGGGWARNQGIKKTHGKFIAFLDDDDEWLPEKLEVQMRAFEQTPEDVGFCFSAVINVYEDREQRTQVLDGLDWYADRAIDIKYFSDFLTVTLVVKRAVFDMVGVFDEALPSHQELDFIIRTSKRYRGLGLNVPLVRVNMKNNTPRIGTNLDRRIAGRLRVIEKNFTEIQNDLGLFLILSRKNMASE